METHENFKSLVADVRCAEDIRERVGGALANQDKLDRSTSPWETHLWKDEELKDFHLDLKSIDRLYHIQNEEGEDDSGDDFELVVRVEYKKHHLFVELRAGYHFSDYEYRGGGDIFVCFDANLFTKTITTKVRRGGDVEWFKYS